MEFESIQPIQVLKVKRTGSEQERRRRKPDEGFSNLLDDSIEEEEHSGEDEQTKDGEQATDPYKDTVSISKPDTAVSSPQLISVDTVQLSLAQRIDAGQFEIKGGPVADPDEREIKPASAKKTSEEPDVDEPASIDTLA